MRIALVAETFSPAVNGVVNSVLRTADQLTARGHEVVVVAPSGEPFRTAGGSAVDVVRAPSVRLPGYRELTIGKPSGLTGLLADLDVDIVHLASPAVLGHCAARAANELDIPTIAVYQTDLAAYARRYHVRGGSAAAWRWLRAIHNRAALTLAPSTASMARLRSHGIGPLALWARGVDTDRFHPARCTAALRAQVGAGPGQVLIGSVGRLAPEKRLDLLHEVSTIPGARLVIVGDGPHRARLQRALPGAVFLGQRTGHELARIVASLDVLVHPGADETFCQAVQEALASGVPAVVAASGGPLDLVRHGENGLLWAGSDGAELAALTRSLIESPGLLAAMSRRARPSVVHRTWARVGDELLGHYGRVLHGAAPVDLRPAV